MKNPPWTRDELILALDAYFSISPGTPSPSQPEILALSSLLQRIGNRDNAISESYRSPASVVMKLMNFRSIDPEYVGEGLSATSRTDREVWNEFSDKRDRLKDIAKIIGEVATSAYSIVHGVFPELTEASEGKTLTHMHVTRERNRKLVESKKKKTLHELGFLDCEACGFNFEKVYGERGKGYIECHHIIPLHELDGSRKTKLNELALLCANCHRMIHSQRPWLTVKELKSLLSQPT